MCTEYTLQELDEATMNETQFSLALDGSRIQEKTVQVARDVLVNGLSLKHAADKYGMTDQRVGDIKASLLANFHRNLSARGLKLVECIVPEQFESVLAVFEEQTLKKRE